MVEERLAVPSLAECQRVVIGVARPEAETADKAVSHLESQQVAVKRFRSIDIADVEHHVVEVLRLDVAQAVRVAQGVHAGFGEEGTRKARMTACADFDQPTLHHALDGGR